MEWDKDKVKNRDRLLRCQVWKHQAERSLFDMESQGAGMILKGKENQVTGFYKLELLAQLKKKP